MNTRRFWWGACALFCGLLGAVLVTGSGCQMTARQAKVHTPSREEENLAATQNQLRLRMRALVGPMCGQVEKSADAIIAGTTNRVVQQAALRWKIEAVPALRQALFQPDPLTAVMDTWALCYQMANYFEQGEGKEPLGEARSQAAATCQLMEEEVNRVAASATISKDVSRVRDFTRKWAAEHPIHHSIAGRETMLSRSLERDIRDSVSMGEAMASATTTLDDLNRRLEIYSDQLFRQVRWEAELIKSEFLADLSAQQALPLAQRTVKSVEEAVAAANRVATEVERTRSVVENAPKVLASEREAGIKALHDELTQALDFAQKERMAALEYATRERVTALKDLTDDMTKERKALAGDVEQISRKVMGRTMWQMAQIMAGAVALLLLGAFAGLFLARRMFCLPPKRVDSRP